MNGIELELRPHQFHAHWSRCGLTADWLASYLACELEPEGRAAAKSVLSTVINELLENAVKFCSQPQGSIKIAARHERNSVRIETWNQASAERARLLEGTLAELDSASALALFVQRTKERDTPGAPGIGIIIIRRDHGARVQASLTPRSDDGVDVHVTVDLDLPGMAKP